MPEKTSTYRILIVDDDGAFRATQKQILQLLRLPESPMRFEAIEASGGAEGMATLQADTDIDCVLIDHDMPGGSGMEWMEKILSVMPNMPVVMVTGRKSVETAVEAMKQGAMDYIVKGSTSNKELGRTVLRAIEKADMKRTIEAQREEILAAERQRVMIQSLGAACHHLGQPATVVSSDWRNGSGK